MAVSVQQASPSPGVSTGATIGVGEQLRQWRLRRRYSQLELSNRAEISTRHLSFVETARSAPSREMLLRLADHLEVPLRERNQLLLAAGFAPIYSEAAYDSAPLAAVRQALDLVLRAHEPYPAVVVDRWWNLLAANDAIGRMTAGLPADLLEPPVNVLRLTLHPRGWHRASSTSVSGAASAHPAGPAGRVHRRSPAHRFARRASPVPV